MRRSGLLFLLLAVISDFLTPYGLGLFAPNIHQLTDVMSAFGDVSSPVRTPFLIWSVISGILFVLAVPAIFNYFRKTSVGLASLLALSVGLYGIGDCIFTGLFSINEEATTWNLSTWIHNIGSGVGYAGFFLFPLILILLYRKQGELKKVKKYQLLFVISLIFGAIYGLAQLNLPFFHLVGLWQRVSFFFNYLPMVIFVGDAFKNKL